MNIYLLLNGLMLAPNKIWFLNPSCGRCRIFKSVTALCQKPDAVVTMDNFTNFTLIEPGYYDAKHMEYILLIGPVF